MKRHIKIVLLIFFLFTFIGCIPKKAVVLFEECAATPSDIIKRVSGADNPEKTLKAAARIAVSTPGKRYSARIALLTKRPSFFKVTSMPVIGPPNLFLSVMGDSLKVFLPKKGEFYIGPATGKNIALFFPINLKVEDIVSILFGIPPPVKGENITLQGYTEERLYRVDVISQDKKAQSLWVDTSTGILIRMEVFNDEGGGVYRVKLEDHRQVGEIRIPGRIIITGNEADSPSVRIRYSDTQLSQSDGDTALFDLDIPPDIKPISIEEVIRNQQF
jgi:hypothetical protein